MVEAPVQITDEYVRTYLWEHNLVAIDEGDLRKLMRNWQGLTDEEIRNEANHHVFDESFFSGAIWARGQIMRKNNG